MGRLVITAPAKINLALDVGKIRGDGYHSIRSVMHTLALKDIILLEERPTGLSVSSLPADPLTQGALAYLGPIKGPLPPDDEGNLVWQAAKLLMETTGTYRGLHITLRKAIPLAAGLGGGSSDAAAVLRGLNELWHLGLSTEELMQMGKRIGADVPFCIVGGCAKVEGIGEQVTPLPPAPPWPVILANPGVGVATAECYQAYDELAQPISVDVEELMTKLATGGIWETGASLGNSLEAVVFDQFPVVGELKRALLAAGCPGAVMTGSGPTVVGLIPTFAQGQEIVTGLQRRFAQEPRGRMPKLYLTVTA